VIASEEVLRGPDGEASRADHLVVRRRELAAAIAFFMRRAP
jgi:hypothetical protein